MLISPSILAADLIDLKRVLEGLDPTSIDFIHLDVMDGHFVPQLSFGESYSKAIGQATAIPLDVHLMVDQPEAEVPKYFELKPHNITFHLEATHFPVRLAQLIREQGIKAGIALNPGTSVELLEPVLDEIDMVLLMSVEPGYYGQSFIPSSYRRVARLKELIGDRQIAIEIDGGINAENIGRLSELGVSMAVAGSFLFKGGQPNERARDLKAACGAAV